MKNIYKIIILVAILFASCDQLQKEEDKTDLVPLAALASASASSTSSTVNTVSINCLANSPQNFNGPNYSYSISANSSTVITAVTNANSAYDISDYCATAINARRQTLHTRTKSGTTANINPYYQLSDGSIIPAYTAIQSNVTATTGSSVCRLCKGLADAKASGHAGYGMCFGIAPDPTGPITNEVSVGWCGATIGDTAKSVVDNCLNSFENEDGGGHKGPILWDSTRGISCTIGVYVDPSSKAKKAGISINYSYPPREAKAANGTSCKVSGECLSKSCSNSRCVGFANSIPSGGSSIVSGVSTCPATDSKNCTEHPEDTSTCFSKNLACSSGNCTDGTCR